MRTICTERLREGEVLRASACRRCARMAARAASCTGLVLMAESCSSPGREQ